jgi:hypothetical protein
MSLRRLALLSLAAAVILTNPAMAQKEKGGRIFGNVTCRANIPCPESYEQKQEMTPSILAEATQCAAIKLGQSGNFFDEMAGLGHDNCLTSKPADVNSDIITMTPRCCLMPMEGKDGYCKLNCLLISNR